MAELADAYGLGPYTVRCGGSSPSIRINDTRLEDRKNKRIEIDRNFN